ncbi:MAG: hypothetical protein R3F61_01205 [Myxococcota bacterium]
MIGSNGLKTVGTEDLKQILRLVHRGELECPITEIGLATTQLLRLLDELGALRGLDKRGVSAVLVCVIAERRA